MDWWRSCHFFILIIPRTYVLLYGFRECSLTPLSIYRSWTKSYGSWCCLFAIRWYHTSHCVFCCTSFLISNTGLEDVISFWILHCLLWRMITVEHHNFRDNPLFSLYSFMSVASLGQSCITYIGKNKMADIKHLVQRNRKANSLLVLLFTYRANWLTWKHWLCW